MTTTKITKKQQQELKKIREKRLEKEIKKLLEKNEAIIIKISLLKDELLELQEKHPNMLSDKVFSKELKEKWAK